MKILVLANNDMGLYKFRKELLEHLILKHEVHIALPEGEYVTKMIDMGTVFHSVSINRRGKNILEDIGQFKTYIKIIRDISPDVVLTYTIKPNIYGGIACRFCHIPYIANITGLGSAVEAENFFGKMLVRFYRWALKKAKCIFFQNVSNKEFFVKCGLKHNNIKVLPGSGVNIEEHCYEEYPAESDKLIFLFIGRLMRDKGVIELLEAAKQIKSKYENIEFRLVGFCEEEFEKELKERNVEEYVSLYGQQDDVHSFIKGCHAVILPSYHEGMANVLLEAAACGRPVLASDIPGCQETFEEECSGFGFSPRSVESLKEAIEKFIALDYSQKSKMGKKGRVKIEKEFNRNIIIDRYTVEIESI